MTTEKRMIDANALFRAIKEDKVAWRFGVPNTLKLMFDYLQIIINEQPTVDAVEVVRCKDCKNRDEYGACVHPTISGYGWEHLSPKVEDFCSYGERKDND